MNLTRKFYVMISAASSHDGKPYWHELKDIKSLTEAKIYVERNLAGLKEAEIGMTINDGVKTVVAKRNKSSWS
jgi:hypothetical protein